MRTLATSEGFDFPVTITATESPDWHYLNIGCQSVKTSQLRPFAEGCKPSSPIGTGPNNVHVYYIPGTPNALFSRGSHWAILNIEELRELAKTFFAPAPLPPATVIKVAHGKDTPNPLRPHHWAAIFFRPVDGWAKNPPPCAPLKASWPTDPDVIYCHYVNGVLTPDMYSENTLREQLTIQATIPPSNTN